VKTKIAAILVAVACNAQGNLIDLTPGGFTTDNIPPVFYEFVKEDRLFFTFFDEARVIPLYQFGALNGGTYFHTDLFAREPNADSECILELHRLTRLQHVLRCSFRT
jgi:hypothetical protein